MARHWNRFPREAVDDSYQEITKVMLDGALGNLSYWKLSLLITGPDDLPRSLPTQTIIWFYDQRGAEVLAAILKILSNTMVL